MQRGSANVTKSRAAGVETRYGIRHETGVWYNHRLGTKETGPHVADPEQAMSFLDPSLAQKIATMLTRDARRGQYQVEPLP